MTSRQSKLQDDTAFRIMHTLHSNPELSQRELAQRVGISLGGLNYCLNALMDKGFIKLENFQNSRHKLKYMYVLTPSGIAQRLAMTRHFLKRKLEEHEALTAEIAALQQEVNNNPSTPTLTEPVTHIP